MYKNIILLLFFFEKKYLSTLLSKKYISLQSVLDFAKCALSSVAFYSYNECKLKILYIMTKAEIVSEIASKTGYEKSAVQQTVEQFMDIVKESLQKGDSVYLRGFGSFIIKERKAKIGRNISKKTSIEIPAHSIPAFKPAKSFMASVKDVTPNKSNE